MELSRCVRCLGVGLVWVGLAKGFGAQAFGFWIFLGLGPFRFGGLKLGTFEPLRVAGLLSCSLGTLELSGLCAG